MTRTSTLLFTLLAATGLGLAEAPSGERLAYRFDEVKSKVVRSPGGDEERGIRVSAGDPAEAGDVVKTGFFGRTVLAVPDRAARFEVFSSTRVRLAGGEPGVLLVLEKGRLKAAFDAFTGASEARRVAAPGALLAVRGTRYGLEVVGGETVLAVFEGTVEVFPSDGSPIVRVERDQYCVFGPKTPPRKEQMGKAGMSEKSWGSRGSGMTDGRQGTPGEGSQGPAGPGTQGRQGGSGGGRGGH
ncbi:MAG: FecR domain-containing protein [Holophagales bacterium]|nr:FecR domain-containing protein [Holophagales bacterium]